eukprot:11789190-Ditylum_brightwellii.AAC.1
MEEDELTCPTDAGLQGKLQLQPSNWHYYFMSRDINTIDKEAVILIHDGFEARICRQRSYTSASSTWKT